MQTSLSSLISAFHLLSSRMDFLLIPLLAKMSYKVTYCVFNFPMKVNGCENPPNVAGSFISLPPDINALGISFLSPIHGLEIFIINSHPLSV
jgi:hypothetical protein